jgi:starch synthase (maltosyl-transferring)
VLPPIIIDAVRPRTPTGEPAKAVVGERVPVSAEIFRDGHDILGARVRWRPVGESTWEAALLSLAEPGLDRWTGTLVPDRIGRCEFQIEAWTDRFATWRHDAEIKAAANDPELEGVLEQGARLLERLTKRADKKARPVLATAIEGLRDRARSIVERLTAGIDYHVAA